MWFAAIAGRPVVVVVVVLTVIAVAVAVQLVAIVATALRSGSEIGVVDVCIIIISVVDWNERRVESRLVLIVWRVCVGNASAAQLT